MNLLERLRRGWQRRRLRDPHWRLLFDAPPPGEWVSIDCQTTGLDVRRDEIIAIDAVRIRGQRLLTSERLSILVRPERALSPDSIRVHHLREQDVAAGLAPAAAARRLLEFIGARPLVGYYLQFDVAMLDRLVRPLIGTGLPQPRIEVSALYYQHKFRRLPPHAQQDNVEIDLRFDAMLADLELPLRATQAAPSDAVLAGLAFIKLRALADG